MALKTRKLLVADASPSFCAALSEALGNIYDLRVCGDGIQALVQLEEFQPDILVTDLTLPGLDGVSLLRSAASLPHRPVLLVTTRFCSAYIENVISELGVDYIVFKPCDMRALAERIHDLSLCNSAVATASCTRTGISNVLLMLGVRAGLKGYTYLEEIIELYRQDPGRSFTKDLYPTVGRENRTSGASVERAIRSAIQVAWNHRNETVWRMYFTACRNGTVPRPTNRAFVATLAEITTRENRCQA